MSSRVDDLAVWMLQEIMLNKHTTEGPTNREVLRELAQLGNEQSAEMLRNDPPEHDFHTAIYYRMIVDFGAKPTYGEIDAFMRLTGNTLTSDQIAVIRLAHRQVEYYLNRKAITGSAS